MHTVISLGIFQSMDRASNHYRQAHRAAISKLIGQALAGFEPARQDQDNKSTPAWSRDSFHSTPSEGAISSSRLDEMEAMLLQEGTILEVTYWLKNGDNKSCSRCTEKCVRRKDRT